jgi:hypothetical protein
MGRCQETISFFYESSGAGPCRVAMPGLLSLPLDMFYSTLAIGCTRMVIGSVGPFIPFPDGWWFVC